MQANLPSMVKVIATTKQLLTRIYWDLAKTYLLEGSTSQSHTLFRCSSIYFYRFQL